jgi:hypothetical protein
MKQLLSLFLFLLPCLAWAQYPSNGNQKITLGEQTTADGLVYRGVAADTTLTAKSDTAAYFVLDTVNINLYTYKASATGKKWIQLGSDTTSLNLVSRFATKLNISDTASMLTPYLRKLDTTNIKYVNTYGTQTVNGAKTFSSTVTGARFDPTSSSASGNGMYLSAANEVAISTNSTNRVTFTSSGRYIFKGGPNSGPIVDMDARTNNTLGDNVLTMRLGSNGNNTSSYLFVGETGNVNKVLMFGNGNISTEGNINITDVRVRNLPNVIDLRTDADGDLFNGASDVNLKNNIEPITYGLNEVLKIKPVEFYWNKEKYNYSGYKTIGFIAQDLMDIIPNAATVSGDGNMQIEYTAIIATLTKAIQEQNSLIKALEQRIINLENK